MKDLRKILALGILLISFTQALAGKTVEIKGYLYDGATKDRVSGDFVRITNIQKKVPVGWVGNYSTTVSIKSAVVYLLCADTYGYYENCQPVPISPSKKTVTVIFAMVRNPNIRLPSPVYISEYNDCAYSFITDPTTVAIGEETHDFPLYCDFPNDIGFKTAAGVNCQITSGMCSDFFPQGEIIVSCADGSYGVHYINCP